MRKLQFTNEKGNVKPNVREKIKSQGLDMVETLVKEKLSDSGATVQRNARGGLSIQVAVDEFTNEPVYLELSVTANTTSVDYKPSKTSKIKKDKPASTVVENLFD